jgi:ATP-binding cassette subfamily B protein
VKLVRLLFARSLPRWLVVCAIALPLLAALVPTLPPLMTKHAIDDGVVKRDPTALLHFVLLYIAVVFFEATLNLLSQLALASLGQRSMHALRGRLFHHLQTLDLAYFEREPRGRILTRVTNDVEALSELFTSGAVTMGADILLASTIVVAMLAMNVRLTLVAFVVVPPMMYVAELFRRRARDAFRAIRTFVAKLNAFLSENLAGAMVTQAFVREAQQNALFAQVSGELQQSNKAAIRVDAWLFAVVEAIGTFSVAGMIWYGGRGLAGGALEVGVLVAFIQYVQRFFIPVRDLSSKFTIIQSGLVAAERINQFLEVRPALPEPAEPKQPARATPLELKDVSFSYDAERPVLRAFTFALRPGAKLAIVGPTGSGKTTLIKLLLRLIDPQHGVVSAGGVPLREWDSAWLKKKIALVPQDPILFEGTVRSNLTLFDAAVSDDQLWAAARSIGTDKLLNRLHGGLDAPVRERGANLSSGEAQLLAFTRAVVQQPEILILDEATSAIDATAEAAVQEGLERMLEGRTAVIIAHRLATIRLADEILVLAHGQIAEHGTHDELWRLRGLYHALYELQFAA